MQFFALKNLFFYLSGGLFTKFVILLFDYALIVFIVYAGGNYFVICIYVYSAAFGTSSVFAIANCCYAGGDDEISSSRTDMAC